MCHPIAVDKMHHCFELEPERLAVKVIATVKVNGQTGVEMEALTAVNVALLTIYDMCKAIDKTMELGEIHLEEKSGGKSRYIYQSREAELRCSNNERSSWARNRLFENFDYRSL